MRLHPFQQVDIFTEVPSPAEIDAAVVAGGLVEGRLDDARGDSGLLEKPCKAAASARGEVEMTAVSDGR
ncbi:hypothetical protein [Sorangium sp. So ce341]|uniref:hypothetical protein n=1 Tax=Sorangium sp. So ce341 TaxID=3133302 RepID=UPI003F63B220